MDEDHPPLPPSSNGSRRGLSRLVPKCFGKDLLHPQTSQDLPPPPTITPEPNPVQFSDVGVANLSPTITSEQPDPKVMKEKLANAKADLDGIRHVSGMVDNAASASNNL
ncbi:hypothetical protein BDR03DRAFT_1095481 [Suillus americanus]|nr:hypothetical protein BDR03DRAFT_1095481 [Suillus americanus]